MRVEIHAFDNQGDLQHFTNKFLSEHPNVAIEDIQYQMARGLINMIYSVMIVYKEVAE